LLLFSFSKVYFYLPAISFSEIKETNIVFIFVFENYQTLKKRNNLELENSKKKEIQRSVKYFWSMKCIILSDFIPKMGE
jgi:hypothetical protein